MKIFEGIIVSTGMNKTVVVETKRRTAHPLYKKLIKRSKKYKADANGLELALGMKVKIVETKPISRNKFFKVTEIIGLKNIVNSKKQIANRKTEKTVRKVAPATVRGTAKKKERAK